MSCDDVGESLSGFTGLEDEVPSSNLARRGGSGKPSTPTLHPNQSSCSRRITHAPFSTLTERTLRRPPRSLTLAQSLSSRQQRPWKSSSSQSVRLAGAGPGAGALLILLRTGRAGPRFQLSRATCLAKSCPNPAGCEGPKGWTEPGSGHPLPGAFPHLALPDPSTRYSPGG